MIAHQPQGAQRPWFEAGRQDKTSSKRFVAEERRRHERISVPVLAVAFNGATHTAVSWSLGGFEIEGYRGALTPGALFSIEALGKVDGDMTKVSVRARVVRTDETRRRLVVGFLDLDGRAYGVLHEVMSERMRILKERNSG